MPPGLWNLRRQTRGEALSRLNGLPPLKNETWKRDRLLGFVPRANVLAVFKRT